jgi:heme/copper-type cytochrome/quinol oxidase subunit 2
MLSWRKSVSDSGQEPRQLKASDFVTGLASLVVALAGSMYLASYSERTVFFEPFGLSTDMFSYSVQGEIANGAITMAFFLMMMVVMLIGVWLIGISIRRYMELRAERKGVERARWSRRTNLFLRRTLFFSSLMLAILAAPGVGYWTGAAELSRAQLILQQQCALNCYTYFTTDGNTVGLQIAADPSRIAVATPAGVRLIEMSSLRRIAPYTSPK